MMEKVIIGIVGRENLAQSDNKTCIMSTNDAYRRAIIQSGGIPFSILPTQDFEYPHYDLSTDKKLSSQEKEDFIRILKMCDGIVIPGGCKIYQYDQFIAKYALENDIPVLGICLGMQVLASVDCEGEIVVKPLEEGFNHQMKDKVLAHKVKLDKKSKLYEIVKTEEFMINSRHRCHVLKTNHFDIVGYAEDGVVEAIERKDKKFAIGVQWHPELIIHEREEAKKIFEKFVASCRN